MSSIDDIVLGTFSHVFDFGIIPLAPAASVTLEPGSNHRLKLTQREHEQETSEGIEKLRNKVYVPMMEFLVFLYIQHFGRVSVRTIDDLEELPASLSSPEHRDTYTFHITLQQRTRLKFLRQHAEDILTIVLHPETYKQRLQGELADSEIRIPASHICCLDWLFCVQGTQDTFSKVLKQQEYHRVTGFSKLTTILSDFLDMNTANVYSRITETFLFPDLLRWLRDHLVLPPFVSVQETKPFIRADLLCPAVISRLSRATQMWDTNQLDMIDLHIHKCNTAVLYILSPLRHVWIDECIRCTIVVGAVAGVLHLSNSRRCTIVATCSRLMSRMTTDTLVHLCTNTRPILLDSTQSLTLAPYHTFYGSLERHMAKAKIFPLRNLWNQPLHVFPTGASSIDGNILDPQKLCPFTIPFDTSGETKKNPCAAPSEYQLAVIDNLTFARKFRESLKQFKGGVINEITTSTNIIHQFEATVQSSFVEWLMQTKRLRQVHDLTLGAERTNEGDFSSTSGHA
eukprot:gene8726-1110_t